MATILIDPINTQSRMGYPVTIVGLDPTSGDCIVGDISPHGAPQTRARWNLDGTARDQTPDCNIDMSDPDLEDLSILARHLGVK